MKEGTGIGRRPGVALTVTMSALALLAGGASAQSPDQRRAIDAFRDSLEAATDSSALRATEARLMRAARRARHDAFVHLQLGLIGLRFGDLGRTGQYDDAASEFKWATELAPRWPYAWYGLGLAEYALGATAGVTGRDRRPMLSRDAWQRASIAFGRALTLEPAFSVRLEELARAALRQRVPAKAEVVREALRRAVAQTRGPAASRLLLGLGRIQRETGDSGARASFEAYLATGENRALALLELGRTRLMAGDLQGLANYHEGATLDDPVAVQEYRLDLQPLATDFELADFDLRRGAARAEVVRRFWITRDRLELRRDGERLAEHFNRLAQARREFVVRAGQGAERFDDRGRIYIRHGQPDDRAGFATPGVEPNESWRYRRAAGDLVLHFVARQAPNDYRLIESVFDVSDVRGGATAGLDGAAAPGSDQLLRSRAGLSPLYERLPAGRPEQITEFITRERALGRRSLRLALLTDSYAPRFEYSLDAWASVVVTGRADDRALGQMLFAVPGYAIEPRTIAGGFGYPIRVRLVALDPAGAVVASLDTLYQVEVTSRIPANRSASGRLAVPLPAGQLVVRALVSTGTGELEGGSVFGPDTLYVPAPEGPDLALGDVVLGAGSGRLAVPLGDGNLIGVVPGGVYRRGEPLELGVEVFGLGSGTGAGAAARAQAYVAELTEAALDDPSVLRWREYPDRRASGMVTAAADGSARWRVSLPLNRLRTGRWVVAVVVMDGAGRTARREVRLEVQAP